jgi:hypothetical protein
MTIRPKTTPSGGDISYACATEGCQALAAIVIRGPKGYEWSLCRTDWLQLNRHALGLMEIVRQLERPSCFRGDCRVEAVVVVEHLDRTPLPVYQQHWDDLSWVRPEDPDGPALLGRSGRPGCQP